MNSLEKILAAVAEEITEAADGKFRACTSWDQTQEPDPAGTVVVGCAAMMQITSGIDDYQIDVAVNCRTRTSDDADRERINAIAATASAAIKAITREALSAASGSIVAGVVPSGVDWLPGAEIREAVLHLNVFVTAFDL